MVYHKLRKKTTKHETSIAAIKSKDKKAASDTDKDRNTGQQTYRSL